MRRVFAYDAVKPKVTFESESFISAAGSSHTHSSMAFGDTHAARYIAVAVDVQVTDATSVTIGGVAATLVESVGVGGFYSTFLSLWIASVPTGTTGDVVVSAGSAIGKTIVHVFRIVGITSATATATITDDTAPIALSIAVQNFGIVIAAESHTHGITTGDPTWTGGVVQVATTQTPAVVPVIRLCSAIYEASAGATLSLGVTVSNPAGPCALAASFR